MWSIMASYSGFAALFFKKNHSTIPFILTLQEGDSLQYIRSQVRLVSGWFKQIFTKADRIQAISTYLAQWAKEMGATTPITVVPNGVDLALFTHIFSEIQKQPHDIFLVTTSRLVEKNGVADIIKSLAHLPTNIKLLIIGDGPLRAQLEQLVKVEKVIDQVLFLGQKEYKTLPKYLKVSDIFIRPSLSEGMGNSFIEAMAAGLPIIATPVGGIPDFLIHEQTGLFCLVKDPESIAREVQKLINNRELRDRVVSNARKIVKEKYDWSLIAQRMRKEIFN
jgi:glycosyltransferase involved in cell wall biosynthesis